MGGACSTNENILAKKVLLIGPRGSGKTTLLYSWVLGKDGVIETKPTVSFHVEKVILNDSKLIMVWDVSDEARRRQFLYGTDAVLYLIDSSASPTDLSSVRRDLHSVLRNADLSDVPLLVVLNKQDLHNPLTTETVEKQLELSSLSGRQCLVIGVSTLDWDSVQQALLMLRNLLKF